MDIDKFSSSFAQQMREVSAAALLNAMITGSSYMKMTVDFSTKEIHFELLNPFTGCYCETKSEDG